jgi:hypothetical protein
MKIHFDLSRETNPYNRTALEERIAESAEHAPASVQVVDGDPDAADWIIDPVPAHQTFRGPYFSDTGLGGQRASRTLTWDPGDFPTGRRRGFYCSLPRTLFDPRRHRSFCYLIRYNPFIAPFPPGDATYLWGFSGSVTSPLRARLFSRLAPSARDGTGLLRQTASLFHAMADPASDPAKQAFAEDIRRCQFVICPRGNGVSSVRIFEVLEAGRVPVILSDALVPPACVDWDACALRVPESDLPRLPVIIAAHREEYSRRAEAARREWERCFSPSGLLPTLAGEIRALETASNRSTLPMLPPGARYLVRLLPFLAKTRLKALVRRVRSGWKR